MRRLRPNRRQSERVQVAKIVSDCGRVVDLSDRGMRVMTTRSWAEHTSKQIRIAFEDAEIQVEARCIWTRQESLLSHTSGLSFDELGPKAQRTLRLIAQAAADSNASSDRS